MSGKEATRTTGVVESTPVSSQRAHVPAARRARGRHTYLVHPGAAEGLAALVEQRWVSRPELLELALTELLGWLDDPGSDRGRGDRLLSTLATAPAGGQSKVVAIDTYAATRERLADTAQHLRVSMNRIVNLALVALVAAAAPPARGRPIQLGKPSSHIEPALEERLRGAMRRVLDGSTPPAALIARLPSPSAGAPPA